MTLNQWQVNLQTKSTIKILQIEYMNQLPNFIVNIMVIYFEIIRCEYEYKFENVHQTFYYYDSFLLLQAHKVSLNCADFVLVIGVFIVTLIHYCCWNFIVSLTAFTI